MVVYFKSKNINFIYLNEAGRGQLQEIIIIKLLILNLQPMDSLK